VLARNPALADLLLLWALDESALSPLDDEAALDLRQERLGGRAGTSRRPMARLRLRRP
jgi:CobQ-like glutamine amidotransferase family enzyme